MSMAFGSSRKDLEKRMILQEGETLISPRKYNSVIGLVLLWGFVLNFLMVYFLGDFFVKTFSEKWSPWYLVGGYIVCVLIGWLLVRSKSAFVSFIGYNFIAVPIGVVLSVSLKGVDENVILQAIFVTALVTGMMFLFSFLFPRFFLKTGRVLFFALFACVLVEIGCILIWGHEPAILDWIIALLFSVYIGYDWARANKCQKTMNNAVDISTSLYLDIINLFIRLVQLIGREKE